MVSEDQQLKDLMVREYDLQGNMVDSVHYNYNNETVFTTGSCLFSVLKNRFIAGFSINNSVRFLKFKRNWDTVSSGFYQVDTFYTIVHSLHKDSDSTFVANGWFYNEVSKRSNLFLTRFDTAFNPLWEQRYYDSTNVAYGGFFDGYVIPTQKGFMMGIQGFYASNNPIKGFIIGTDSLGNELWRKEFSNKKGIGLVQMAARTDGQYLFIAPEILDTNYRSFDRPSRLRFGVIDADGQITVDKRIGPILDNMGNSVFTQTLDGNFVTGGYTYVDPGKNVSYLFKFSPDGDSIWHRNYWYGYPEAFNMLYTARATADSGLVLTGYHSDLEYRHSPLNSTASYTWLLKLDQHGCDTAGCHQIGLPETKLSQIPLKVYPNPAREQFTIAWPETQESVQLKIFNTTGQPVYEEELKEVLEKTIDTRQWPAGMYHLQINSGRAQQSRAILIEKG